MIYLFKTSDGEMAAGLLQLFYWAFIFIEIVIVGYILFAWNKKGKKIFTLLNVLALIPIVLLFYLFG